jgi:hypothetical protein
LAGQLGEQAKGLSANESKKSFSWF